MTKRNRSADSSTLQRLIGAKTMKTDLNQGSARRGLPLLEKRENQGGGKNSTFLRKTQKICHFFGRRRRPKTHFLTFFKVARRRRKIFMILCDVMMGNTVVIDHLGDDFRSQLTEICKFFRLRRAILKNVESPPLLENRENQGGGNSTISVDAAL